MTCLALELFFFNCNVYEVFVHIYNEKETTKKEQTT